MKGATAKCHIDNKFNTFGFDKLLNYSYKTAVNLLNCEKIRICIVSITKRQLNMLERWFGKKSHRIEELEKIAKDLGLSFLPKDEFGLINLLKDFKLFRRGGRKRIINILGEKDYLLEADFRIFDYRYTIK